ncbi:MAG: DedA family protein [Chloroflexi bacterium]|nr:DedA family protein [Chloroflexota bacterium]
MEILKTLFDIFLHLDKFLGEIITQYGTQTYVILFLVIFCETGLVVTPFLPGDSLIFAAGTFAAMKSLDPLILFVTLIIAAVGGDAVNYWIGHKIGPRAYTGEIKLIKKEYIDRTHAFFEKHGGKTIFLARFVPIVRTFAPFVAGIGQMSYGYFLRYNLIGGIVWVSLFLSLGYFFGAMPIVQKNFELVIIAIILISAVPMIIEWLKARRENKK